MSNRKNQPKDNCYQLSEDVLKKIKEFKTYLEDLQLSFETIKTYVIVLKQYTRDVKKGNPETTNLEDIKDYRTYCKDRNFAKSSLINKYASLRRYIEYLVEEKELLDYKTLKKVKKILISPTVKDKFVKPLTKEEVEKVFRIARKRKQRDYAILLTMYEGCLRRTELLNIKLSDVDLKNKQIKIEGIKRENDRIINISTRCANALRDYIDNYRGEPLPQYKDCLFLNYDYRLSKNVLFALNKEYKMRADLPNDFTLHGWRHTGTTHITMKTLKETKANVPLTLKILQSQTGHKDVNVLLNKYVNVYNSEIKEFYDNIWNDEEETKTTKPEEPKPEPKKREPKPQDTYIASSDPDIRIKELELELLKLKQQKQSRNDLNYHG